MDIKQINKIEDKNTIIEQREELMIPPNCEGNPTLRIAHFLKPLLNPKIQPLPKPPLYNSLSSNPQMKDLYKRISLKSVLRPHNSWKSWVEDLQQTHESIWKKVGIFDAIKGSNYKINRDKELIMCLAEKWCIETNTFVFSWGEITITLEDIMILGGFSVMGNSVFVTPFSKSNKFAKIKGELLKCVPIIRRNSGNFLTPKGWLDYFMGKGGELEHVAFLVFWLSRYVFLSSKCINVGKNNVFDIAINLAFGTKIALAPAVLASIYRDLTTLKQKILDHGVVSDVVGSQIMIWGPLHFVQFWAWERFPESSPKPASLAHHGQLRMARWHDVKKLKRDNLRLEIEYASDSFVWRPYAMCLKNWNIPKFYCEEGMWVVVNSDLDEELLSFVRCLRPCELVGLDCVMQYSPHRVGMQFGMDQDIPDFVHRFDEEYIYTHSWSSYAKPMEGVKVYLPPRLFEGDVTVQYSRWWKSRLEFDDDARKGCSQKRKSLSMLIEGGLAGRCSTKALICSSFEDMMSEKPLQVVGKIASNTALLNQQEGIVVGKENGNMIDCRVTSNTASNEQMLDIVSVKEKEKVVDETTPNTALYEQEGSNAEHSKGKHAQDIELSTMTLNQTVKVNDLGLESKKSCSVLAEDRNQLGKDAREATEVKHAFDSPADVEEQMDFVKQIQQRSLLIDFRMSRLEKIVSMYKQARFGWQVDA